MSPTPPAKAWRPRLAATSMFLGATLAWLHWGHGGWGVVTALTAVLALLAWFAPPSYAPVYRVLESLVEGFLAGLSWALLAIVFALVFVPGRLVWKLSRRGAIERRAATANDSFFRPVPPPTDREEFRRQF